MSGGTSGEPAGATMPRLIALFRPERRQLSVIGGLTAVSVCLTALGPWLLGEATNILFYGSIGQGRFAHVLPALHLTPGAGVDFARLGETLGGAAAAYALSAVLVWAQGYLTAGVGQRVVYRLRESIENKLARLPLGYVDSQPHGEILSRVTNDVDNIDTVLEGVLGRLPVSALTVLVVIGVMFWISPLLAVVSLATVPLVIIVSYLITRRSKVRFEAQWKHTGRLNALVEETYSGHDLVLAFGQRGAMNAEFGQRNEKVYEAAFRAQFLSGIILPAILLVSNLSYVAVAVVGGVEVAGGAITLGAVQAFIQYAGWMTTPVTDIASQVNSLQSGLASLRRVFEFLDVAEESADITPPAGRDRGFELAQSAQAGRRLRLEHVSFRYEQDRPLIEDFTLEAAPGQTIAIVGPTGAGKTTVVNLLMRFYEIGSGRILLDGIDYRDLTREEVRGCFGMVLQDTWLFAGTIWDNIAYGKAGATDAEVLDAARAAYVDDFVRTLPDGYATMIDPDSSSISVGQRQLLTIARAFIASPGILILDEATSAVDTRTEVMIQDAMTRLRRGRTSFVIAHRLSTIRTADIIVVMADGRIAEQGTHTELLSLQGVYRDLYNSQFEGVTAP